MEITYYISTFFQSTFFPYKINKTLKKNITWTMDMDNMNNIKHEHAEMRQNSVTSFV